MAEKRPIPSLLPSQNHYLKSYIVHPIIPASNPAAIGRFTAMTHLLSHFDREKASLKNQIEATPSPAEAVNIIESYFDRLHRDMAECYSMHQYRHLGHLLETIRYGIRTLLTVDKRVHYTALDTHSGPESVFRKQIWSALRIHLAIVILLLLLLLITTGPISETPLLLVLMLFGIDGYAMVALWKTRFHSKRHSGVQTVSQPPPVEIQLNISESQKFLNHIADALSFADKLLATDVSAKSGAGIENDSQILTLFQDLHEAMYFQDGDWALKKISAIRAILRENGITVKEFDSGDATGQRYFDLEPGADSSIRQPFTIRPAFIKGNRVLLRGKAAGPADVHIPESTDTQEMTGDS